MRIQKPSSRFRYAIRALVDLSIHQATGPVTVKAIAQRQRIPLRYLEQLFHRLRQQNLVTAERGPRGGYQLSRPAKEIPVSLIFHSLEPAENGSAKPFRQEDGADPMASVWRQVEKAIQTTLQATTLEALVHHVQEKTPSPVSHSFAFHI